MARIKLKIKDSVELPILIQILGKAWSYNLCLWWELPSRRMKRHMISWARDGEGAREVEGDSLTRVGVA